MGQLRSPGAPLGCRGSQRQKGSASALEAPLPALWPLRPAWETSQEALPVIPPLVLAPPWSHGRDSQSLQLGPLPLTQEIPGSYGEPRGGGVRVRTPNAAPPSQGHALPLGSAEGGEEVSRVPRRTGPWGASGAPGEGRCSLSEPWAAASEREMGRGTPENPELSSGCGLEGDH